MDYYKDITTKDLPNEQWVDIKGFKGFYQVSNMGRVRSLERTVKSGALRMLTIKGRILCQKVTDIKYKYGAINRILCVALNRKRNRITKNVSRLVFEAFLAKGKKLPKVDFKNKNPLDCRADNLFASSRISHSRKRNDVLNGIILFYRRLYKIIDGERVKIGMLENGHSSILILDDISLTDDDYNTLEQIKLNLSMKRPWDTPEEQRVVGSEKSPTPKASIRAHVIR